MTQPIHRTPHPPVPSHPAVPEDVKQQQQKAEEREVAGRHKNEGQNDGKRRSNLPRGGH